MCREAYAAYQRMLDAGVAREVARIVLPLSIYSSMYVTMNARSLMNFLSLRTAREGLAVSVVPAAGDRDVRGGMEEHWAPAHADHARGGRRAGRWIDESVPAQAGGTGITRLTGRPAAGRPSRPRGSSAPCNARHIGGDDPATPAPLQPPCDGAGVPVSTGHAGARPEGPGRRGRRLGMADLVPDPRRR